MPITVGNVWIPIRLLEGDLIKKILTRQRGRPMTKILLLEKQ
jgi:hypothetical protein